jgi:aldose 1-epimerase
VTESVYTLANAAGMKVRFISPGGIIVSLDVPDRSGAFANVTPAYENYANYERDPNYFGAIVGRCANRIANARFTLDGTEHQLPANVPPNHLHGGPQGFHRQRWQVQPASNGRSAALTYTSPANEEGYPGTLEVVARYSVTDANVFIVEFEATTDAPTPVNLTQHLYFNLAGAGRGDILDHELTLRASRFTPMGEGLLPTGEIRSVEGTPFDFRRPLRIGARIDDDDEQLRRGGGYDHNFVLDTPNGADGLRLAATLRHASGRTLELLTTTPGLQFYAGNMLRSPGDGAPPVARRSALALEPQHFPNAVNEPSFPSPILRPGDRYVARTEYRFPTPA